MIQRVLLVSMLPRSWHSLHWDDSKTVHIEFGPWCDERATPDVLSVNPADFFSKFEKTCSGFRAETFSHYAFNSFSAKVQFGVKRRRELLYVSPHDGMVLRSELTGSAELGDGAASADWFPTPMLMEILDEKIGRAERQHGRLRKRPSDE